MRFIRFIRSPIIFVLCTGVYTPTADSRHLWAQSEERTSLSENTTSRSKNTSISRSGRNDSEGGKKSNGALSLAECVATALKNRPELKAERAQVRVSSAQIQEAKSSYFPSLSVNAGYERHKYSYNPKGGMRPQGTPRNDWVLGSSLNWSLSGMIATTGRVRAAGAKHRSVKEAGKAAKRQVVLEVVQAYYRVLEMKEYIALLDAILERAGIHLKYAQRLLDVGKGSKADVLRAEVEMARTRLEMTKARSGHRQARAALKTAMGISLEKDVALKGIELKVEEKVFRPVTGEKRPEQEAGVHLFKSYKHLRDAASNDFWPDFKLYGGMELHEDIFFPRETNWFVGVSLEIPVFSYYGKTARWKLARAQMQEAKARVSEVDAKIALEKKNAFLQLKEAKEALKAARALEASAKKNLEVDEKSYRAGAGSMVALADGRAAYFSAKAEVIRAVFNAFVKAADYRHASGKDVIP